MIIQRLLNLGAQILRTTVRQHCAEIRCRAIMRVGHILGAVASFVVSMTIALIIVVLATVGVVRWLETIMASHWACLSVAGMYVLLYVMVRVFRQRLFYRPISRYLTRNCDKGAD